MKPSRAPCQSRLAARGCSLALWTELRDIGLAMRAAGKPIHCTPLVAFSNQKGHAKERGIGFLLSLEQWWEIWVASGKYEQRGRGDGYVMSRVGDVGDYVVGNVFIDTNRRNASLTPHKISDLPQGVWPTTSGRYKSFRGTDGRRVYLGSFDTPEAAHSAYLRAGAQ